VDGEHTGLGTVAQSGATRATKLVAKNAEKATTTNEEKKQPKKLQYLTQEFLTLEERIR